MKHVSNPGTFLSDSDSKAVLLGYFENSEYAFNQSRRDQLRMFLDNPNEWVKATERMQNAANVFQDVTGFIDIGHHVRCFIDVLSKLHQQKARKLVVFGHKHHGKSQFLFFLSQTLKKANELVIYVDNSFALRSGDFQRSKCLAESESWAAALEQQIPHTEYGNTVHERFMMFRRALGYQRGIEAPADISFERKSPVSYFTSFLFTLQEYLITYDPSRRVWLLVDEVTAQKDYLEAFMPEEQEPSVFYTIVTGSAKMGDFVSTRHLKKWTYDFPLFTCEEMANLARKLDRALIERNSVGLTEAIGIHPGGDTIGWIMDNFAGIPGYLVELSVAVANGESAHDYSLKLYERTVELMNTLLPHEVKRLKTYLPEGFYHFLQDAGLCGNVPPGGLVFRFIVEYILKNEPDERGKEKDLTFIDAVLSIDKRYSGGNSKGTLTELRILFNFGLGRCIQATMHDPNGMSKSDRGNFPRTVHIPSESIFSRCDYDRLNNVIAITDYQPDSRWMMVKLPTNFPVIDMLFLEKKSGKWALLWGIQVTVSARPYDNHETFTQFQSRPGRGAEAVANLFKAIENEFDLPNTIAARRFLMYAPCVENEMALVPKTDVEDIIYYSKSPMLETPAVKKISRKRLHDKI